MTELWAKNVCPYMARVPYFDYILAVGLGEKNRCTHSAHRNKIDAKNKGKKRFPAGSEKMGANGPKM